MSEVKWTEIEHLVGGAIYDLTSYNENNDEEREAAAEWVEQVKFEAKLTAGDNELWELYVYPHSCDFGGDGECICRQYDLDHKATWTNEKVDNNAK